MTFRDLLYLYKDGTLEGAEKELVETEIEKHEAISDYLFEESNIPDLAEIEATDTSFSGNDDKQSAEFLKLIKSSIRRAFIKMGVTVGISILAIVLAFTFVVPKAVSSFYYNPTEVVATTKGGIFDGYETTRMELDLSVFSELFLPGRYRNYVICEDEGYGVYNITIPPIYRIGDGFGTVAGKLTRNKLTLYDPNLLKFPSGSVFIPTETSKDAWGAAGSVEDSFEALKGLNEGTYYTAYFSLDKITDYDSFYNWCISLNSQDCQMWCNVDNGDIMKIPMGFNPIQNGSPLSWDQDTYPILCTLNPGGTITADTHDEEEMLTHYTSMLKYMRDNPHIMEIFGANENIVNWDEALNSSIDYVSKYGLKISSFVITAKKDKILEIAADRATVSYVYTTPLN